MDRPRNRDEQEDAVIDTLLRELTRAGSNPALIERPDREPVGPRFPTLTTDVVLELDGATEREIWSVDVMSLAADPTLFTIPNALYEALEPVAVEAGLMLTLEGSTPTTSALGALVGKVKEILRGSHSRRGERDLGVGDVALRWADPTGGLEPGLNLILVPEVGSALLSDQILQTIRDPLTKKATRQAKPAAEAGLKSAVLLDRVGHVGIAQGTHWLPQYAATFQVAVSSVLAGIEHHLDAVLLHGVEPGFAVVLGEFPGLTSSQVG